MIKREYNIKIDLKTTKKINTFATFIQGDLLVNYINISMYNNNTPLDLTPFKLIQIVFKRGDDVIISGNALDIKDAQNGKLGYLFGSEEVAEPGRVDAAISLYGENGEKISTVQFYFNVVEEINADDVIATSNQYGLLSNLIEEVKGLKPNKWLIGNEAPGDELGQYGDIYMNISNGDIYTYEMGVFWVYQGTVGGSLNLPQDGQDGQVLTVKNDVPGGFVWTFPEIPKELPANGLPGQILKKTDNGVEWVTLTISENHNNLKNIQGGANGEHYHLTLDEKNSIRKITFMTLEPDASYGEDGEIIIIYE